MMMMTMIIIFAVVHFAKNLTALDHYAMINTRMDRRLTKRRIMGFKLKHN